MQLYIPKDYFDNPRPPSLYLCTQSGKRMQELSAYDVSLDAKWNSWSEMGLTIDRMYTDILTGVTKVHPAFDKAEGLRQIEVKNMCRLVIQDTDAVYGEKDSKSISAFSIEHSLGSRYLESFVINAGSIDSKEVIYLESVYGYNYTIDQDNLYVRASGSFDVYESYYIKDYTDNDSYVYQQVAISNSAEYATYDGSTVAKTLYVKAYPNVRFYYPTKPELSLLHLIFNESMPDWKIGDVDVALWRKERKFEIDRQSVYDFLMQDVSDTFNCIVSWDTLNKVVNFYEEVEDGVNDDRTIVTRYDTDIYISRDNLASEIQIKYSTDDIRTKLKISGADDISIREVNLGRNYIMNLDYYHTLDWMEQDLFEAYDDYIKAVEEYTPMFTEAAQNRVATYNKWNDLMNAVPADGNVVLVGDEFKKLYCIFDRYKYVSEYQVENTPTYYIMSNDGSMVVASPQPTADNFEYGVYYVVGDETSAINSLIDKLNAYHVDDDIDADKIDNILLRLKNSDNDVATIRIYDPKKKDDGQGFNEFVKYYTKDEYVPGKYRYNKVNVNKDTYTINNNWYINDYKIHITIVRASSGISETPQIRELSPWVNGELRVSNTTQEVGLSFLDGFKVSYIGTMGAYLVLAKNEKEKANLQDYGVNLLQEKHDTYTTIFQTQTEALFSQEKYQVTASAEAPPTSLLEGTVWYDTDSLPAKWYMLQSGSWVDYQGTDLKDRENYQRYADNYEKLQTVQEVLSEKTRQATYVEDGYSVPNRVINLSLYENVGGTLYYKGQSLEGDMHRAAEAHFIGYTVTRSSINQQLPAYYFTTSFDPNNEFVVYLNGTTPYVAYAKSVGLYQSIMDWITKETDFEKFFTEDQWIRLSPFIREDEFSDSNFLLTGYESEEERLEIYNELMEAGTKELNTICQPTLEFSADMANILAIPEFAPLIDQFQLGNFARIHIRDGYAKRSRLLGVHLNFSDLSDFSCDFGNLVTTKSEVDKHGELLEQAVSAGKQVAQAAGDWQRAVDKSNKLEEDIANGLADATLSVGAASGQNIIWDQHGIWGRKLLDGTTDQYDPEQFRIINNKLVFSNDGFQTSKSVMGKFEVDGVEHWGVLSDALIGGLVQGAIVRGGQLEIGGDGGTFRVNPDGSVEILVGDGSSAYASKTDVDILQDARRFYTQIEYEGSTVFSEPGSTCKLTAKVFSWDDEITEDLIAKGAKFSWIRSSRGNDATWNANHANLSSNILTIGNDDIEVNSQFSVQVQFDDTNL